MVVHDPSRAVLLRWYVTFGGLWYSIRSHAMLGLIVVLKGQTTLPWWSYIIALLLGGEL